MNSITDILFDFDDTLSPGPVNGYLPFDILREKFQINDEQEKLLKVLDFELLKEFYLPEVSMHITDLESEKPLHEKVYSIMAERAEINNAAEFIEFMVDYRMNKLEFGLYPEVANEIERLSKDYKLHIFTNALPSRAREVRNTEICKLFDQVFISNTVGFYKPQNEYFDFALKKIGKKPSEVLFVDDKESFLLAAEEIGMNTVLVDRKGKYPESKIRKVLNLADI